MLLRNQLYAGIIDVPEYGVRGKRGDFEPIVTSELFDRAQTVLSGRLPSTAPKLRSHPDFPLRNFVRCAACNRGPMGAQLTALGVVSRRRGPSRTSGTARSGWRWVRRPT